nr:hypothetical protein CFP56_65334 [Quercus suber]
MFLKANLMEVASRIKKGIRCLRSLSYPPKDHPCLLPRIRVSVLVVNSDLHGIYSGEFPFTLQVLLLLPTFLGMAHLLKYDLLGLWAPT